MIDIHSHLLYGVDDGAKVVEESIYIIKKLKSIGVTDLVLTPHYIDSSSHSSPHSINIKKLNVLKKMLKDENVDINLYLGNEIYIDREIDKLLEEKLITGINGTKNLLIELPMSGIYENYLDIFLDLIQEGYKVILAHPERYASFQADFSKLYELKDIGVSFQCNIGSILGDYGKHAKKMMKRMLKEHLVQFVASDIHHNKKDYNYIENSRKIFKKYLTEQEINAILEDNAKELLK